MCAEELYIHNNPLIGVGKMIIHLIRTGTHLIRTGTLMGFLFECLLDIVLFDQSIVLNYIL
jgi:hypothetical protein